MSSARNPYPSDVSQRRHDPSPWPVVYQQMRRWWAAGCFEQIAHDLRTLARLEFHYTPKHGSWLNQAEIEISIFERGCLPRPVSDVSTLEQRAQALEDERSARHATIDWQFTNRQARVKLKKLYPVVKAQLD